MNRSFAFRSMSCCVGGLMLCFASWQVGCGSGPAENPDGEAPDQTAPDVRHDRSMTDTTSDHTRQESGGGDVGLDQGGPDATTDTGKDSQPDGGTDTGTDAGTDTATDAATDTGTDTTLDSADALTDAGLDAADASDAASPCSADAGTGAVGILGCPCPTVGAVGCNGNASRQTLVCTPLGGTNLWLGNGACSSDQRCDTREDAGTTGTCQYAGACTDGGLGVCIAIGPGAYGNTFAECDIDQLPTTETNCPASCSNELGCYGTCNTAGDFRCTGEAGLELQDCVDGGWVTERSCNECGCWAAEAGYFGYCMSDYSPCDAGGPDSGGPDSGGPDSGGPDSGGFDSGAPDSGVDSGPDSGTPDSGASDAPADGGADSAG